MLKYVVDIGFSYCHKSFIFTDPRDALMFAKMAKLHADEESTVNIWLQFDLAEDQTEDQTEDQAE